MSAYSTFWASRVRYIRPLTFLTSVIIPAIYPNPNIGGILASVVSRSPAS